jgi:hypothetical protein
MPSEGFAPRHSESDGCRHFGRYVVTGKVPLPRASAKFHFSGNAVFRPQQRFAAFGVDQIGQFMRFSHPPGFDVIRNFSRDLSGAKS